MSWPETGILDTVYKPLNKHQELTKPQKAGIQNHRIVNQSNDWDASLSVIGCAPCI